MAHFEFKMPDIGEGVAEGEVVGWLVEPGQLVQENQEMVEVMTDKATVTIGAPKTGRIAQLNAQVGEKVAVGSVLVVIETDVSEARPSRPPSRDMAISKFQAPASHAKTAAVRSIRAVESPAEGAGEGPAASAVGDIRESLPGTSFLRGKNGQSRSPELAAEAAFFSEKPLATPATRKLARDLGLDLRQIPPTGPGGRVTNDDVRGFGNATASAAEHSTQTPSLTKSPTGQLEERKPFVGLRRRIAERMRLAKSTAAHFTFVEECEVDLLKGVIERLKPAAEAHGVKLTYLPFIAKAVSLALKKHPILNSSLDEAKNELVYRRYYHIGVATATEQGLMVPVVRDADQRSVLELAKEIERLAHGARDGTLTAKELSGSTFTVSSLGKQGGLLATPVLNHPEVGILGVHRIKERPIVRAGQIVIGHVMMLSLSFDHRVVDGHVGAAFAYDVIAYLENPDLLLLELA